MLCARDCEAERRAASFEQGVGVFLSIRTAAGGCGNAEDRACAVLKVDCCSVGHPRLSVAHLLAFFLEYFFKTLDLR